MKEQTIKNKRDKAFKKAKSLDIMTSTIKRKRNLLTRKLLKESA